MALKGDRQAEEDHVQRHRDEKVCPVTEEGESHGCARGEVCEGEQKKSGLQRSAEPPHAPPGSELDIIW